MQLLPELVDRLKKENQEKEKNNLGPYAYFSDKAKRKNVETSGYRSSFTRDADRINHSLSFARYFDKTQVFFWLQSDIHQKRMLHVQLVSKIAREMADVFKLNTSLVEAIALGHDIGHVPFGHDGEELLTKISERKGIGQYHHNFGSVWFLQEIEMQNLTLPVLDGILGHNGENHQGKLYPATNELTWKQLDQDLENLKFGKIKDPIPKTLEGCLVRFVDTISYISRDVMDAQHLGILSFEDIPESVKSHLGKSNREIINSLITDLIQNSLDQPFISYSEETNAALQDLYKFNLKNIYLHPDKLEPLPTIDKAMHLLWDHYYDDLVQKRLDSKIFKDHLFLNLSQIRTRYPEINTLEKYPYYKQPPEIIVRDFIAGMTDQFFWSLSSAIDPTLEFERKVVY